MSLAAPASAMFQTASVTVTVTGINKNRDGTPDMLQQPLCSAASLHVFRVDVSFCCECDLPEVCELPCQALVWRGNYSRSHELLSSVVLPNEFT